ncbi:hypothetical protein I4F81_004246 [Pyropia yezoensis]|uniref:Uncharacterized protein n=1 Tax=Pyropia yezoensis TaxID=2788 RepID=A0ACC3BV88_PYRYE|nr:hypothetical protein I4F81_004246 [Neopyropia yezoensis]
MSTGVHRLLDGTVSFLRTLVARKLLSRTEARVLTTRRDVYERRVAHPASTPRDWDAYIAYEGALLALLRRRAAASRLSLPVGAALVDKAAARVTYLHTRATRANPGHVDGWLAAAAAALAAAPPVQPEGRGGGSRGGSGGGRPAGRAAPARRRIGTAARVLARALALLPREERLWVAAVRLHAVTGDDVRGGRAVALAGLRQVRQSAALWAAYWALEVAYVSRLREQRRVLGVAVPGGGQAAGARGAPPPALTVLAARLLAAHPSDVGAADAVARGGLTAAELVAAPPPRDAARGRRPTGAGRGKPDAADGPRAVVDKAGGVPAGVAIAIADGVATYLRVSPPAVGAAAAALAFAADVRARYAAATPDLVPSDASLVTSYAAAAPGAGAAPGGHV